MDERTANLVALVVTAVLLGAGLLSMGLGWVLPRLARLRAWLDRMAEEGGRMAAARRAHRESLRLAHRMRRLEAARGAEITSSGAEDRAWDRMWHARHSQAQEPPVSAPSGNGSQEAPSLVEVLTQTTDADLLRALAQVRNPDGSWRWAETRIGEFAPGRTADRIAEVREARGEVEAPAAPAGRELVIRDAAGERRIAW